VSRFIRPPDHGAKSALIGGSWVALINHDTRLTSLGLERFSLLAILLQALWK